MKIYFLSKTINTNKLENYIFKNLSYKLIFSEDGIFKIFNDNIYKITIIDKPIVSIKINNNDLLVDKSLNIDNKDVHTIPFNHKVIDIKEYIYKIDNKSNVSLNILYNKENIFNFYLTSNIELDNNCNKDILKFINLIF